MFRPVLGRADVAKVALTIGSTEATSTLPWYSRTVVAGRDCTELLELVDAAFNNVAVLVSHCVEAGWRPPVYDAGPNSTDNHALVEDSQVGFVGSPPPSDHPDLLSLPKTRY